MRRFLPALLLLLSAPLAFGQAITTGTWTGTLEWSNADPVPLSVEIQTCAEGLKLNLSSDDQRYRTDNTVVSTSGPMAFQVRNTARGYTLSCTLNRQENGALGGVCARGSARARLTLQPPAQSIVGCSEG